MRCDTICIFVFISALIKVNVEPIHTERDRIVTFAYRWLLEFIFFGSVMRYDAMQRKRGRQNHVMCMASNITQCVWMYARAHTRLRETANGIIALLEVKLYHVASAKRFLWCVFVCVCVHYLDTFVGCSAGLLVGWTGLFASAIFSQFLLLNA